MADDPLAPPKPPPVQRLNRAVLLGAAAIACGTLLAVAFLATPHPAPRPLPAVRPLAPSNPGFLEHAPGVPPAASRPPLSDEDYMRLLQHVPLPPPPQAGAPPSASPAANAYPGEPPPGTQPPGAWPPTPGAPPPPPTPRDPVHDRREAFHRALHAPLAGPAAAHPGASAAASPDAASSFPFPLLPFPASGAGPSAPQPGAALAPGEAQLGQAPQAWQADAAARASRAWQAAQPRQAAEKDLPAGVASAPDGAATPGSAGAGAPWSGSATAPWSTGSSSWAAGPAVPPTSSAPAFPARSSTRPTPSRSPVPTTSSPSAPSPFSTTLPAGTLIPALLLTQVNSDLPGPLLAQVSRDVYDATHSTVAVPRGTRLLGRYDNQVAAGQRRLLVAWTRLQLPDGSAYALPGLPGTDPAGAAGLPARVENHYLRLFGDAVLLSLLSAGAELSQPAPRNLTLAPSAGSVASAAVGQELATVGLQLLRRDLAVQPTLRLPAGTSLLVFVNGDLELARPAVPVSEDPPR
ncbi:MAG TPA: TrbI/VirB10 family protein [Thermoanaerobaculia bacterium]|nr:TrbI/VirB10 family protein [Thermoanaerobaculia bacterium]